MSQKRHSFEQHRLAGVKIQSGSFKCNGANAPTAVNGAGFTVTYSAPDRYKVTFDSPYRKILSVTTSVQGATAVTSTQTLVDGPSAAASFLVNYVTQDGATKDLNVTTLPAAAANVWLHFHVTFLDIGAQ